MVNITASYGAFAARRADGSIVTWGYESDGGRHNVEEQLKEVSWDLGWLELVWLPWVGGVGFWLLQKKSHGFVFFGDSSAFKVETSLCI